ncbi:hypothetical protein SAMN05216412_102125 [Nitrosospira multiformis]|uniref:Uncharacterized protein n=1 Tax=Nitrosospira multiformis TaxID=1231 RepID=A0A1I0A6S7_9PROT|nr:hypothetical protein SAMN05216412_102125 [Nitrosospira multiformis]
MFKKWSDTSCVCEVGPLVCILELSASRQYSALATNHRCNSLMTGLLLVKETISSINHTCWKMKTDATST